MFLWCSEEAATCEWKSVIALMMISWIFLGFFHTSSLLHTFPSSSRESIAPLSDYMDVSCCVRVSSPHHRLMQMRLSLLMFFSPCSCKGGEGVSMRVEILLMELHYRNFLILHTPKFMCVKKSGEEEDGEFINFPCNLINYLSSLLLLMRVVGSCGCEVEIYTAKVARKNAESSVIT